MRGNALFLILIAVALFAALSYAITQSSRGGGDISKEQAKLDAAVAQNCTARVDQAVMRLEITGGCSVGQISYEYNGNNANADAPADKHCHVFDPAGAGETACGTYLLATHNYSCDSKGSLSEGQQCPDSDVVYVNNALGYRLYTTITDQGTFNGDEIGNWDASALCSALGDGWALPTLDELDQLYAAKGSGALSGTFSESQAGGTYADAYISSTVNWGLNCFKHFSDASSDCGSRFGDMPVRCVSQ